MAHFPRRKFLKTIGGAAVLSAFPEVLLGAQSKAPAVAVFWERVFPAVQGCAVTRELLQQALQGFAVSFLNERDLILQLNSAPFDLLITPYGSAFPKRAWPEILKFLRAGGNWLNLGGVPLSRPVMRCGDHWCLESHQTTYHKQLGITHSFPVQTTGITSYEAADILKYGFKAQQIFELYVRLSSSKSEPDEDGSDGPREGVVHPLMLGLNRERRPIAAPIIQIDRLLANYAGGRWMFANFTGTLGERALAFLAESASQGAGQFIANSEFACYRSGETPSLSVRLSQPKGGL